MKKINTQNINTVDYWNTHPTTTEFGLREEKYLKLAGNGQRIIDIGCGQSPFLDRACDNFEECWGLDYSPETIKKCQQKFPRVNYILSDAVDISFRDNYFDAVVAGEVIEHLEDPMSFLKEMIRICKPEGKLILSTAIMEYKEPEHIWEFDINDFAKLGFETEEIKSERFPGRSYIFASGLKSHILPFIKNKL